MAYNENRRRKRAYARRTNPVLQRIRDERGFAAKIAKALCISGAAVWQWRQVPAQHAPRISKLTGIPLREIRPDIW